VNEIPQTDEYKAEYAKAVEELDAAEKSTTARGPDGKFIKTEEVKTEPVKTEPAKTEVVTDPAKTATETQPDPMAEMRERLERAEKIAKDNQAAFTRMAQETAQLKREREQAAREAARPKILGANPELEEAIRYVAGVPAKAEPADDERVSKWREAVEQVHPGILGADVDPELYKTLETRMQAVGAEWANPFVAIREITAGKLEHAQRQSDKRLADEVAKLTKKSAMSVPGAGGSAVGGGIADADAAEAARFRNMTNAQIDAEARRVKGY
jgi:hypothetical protein